MTMLYIKYTSFVSCCCREDFFIYFHYKSMVDNDMPGAWPVWNPGAPLAGFIKRNTIHCYKQNIFIITTAFQKPIPKRRKNVTSCIVLNFFLVKKSQKHF